MKLIRDFCHEMGLPEEEFTVYVDDARERVKKAKIKKKDKTTREIIIPSWELKIIQYWVILNYLRKLPASESATAYYKGASIIKNAQAHRKGSYFVKVDIESFFPSLTLDIFITSLKKDLESNPENEVIRYLLEATNDASFNQSIFYNGTCVIGYPASPYIANYILKAFDENVVAELNEISGKLGIFNFTRYADDIVVSCENKGNKTEVLKILHNCLEQKFDGALKLKATKTKSTTRSGGSTIITGVLICSDGRTTLPRKYKDKVRLLFSLYAKEILEKEEIPALTGHLNYIRSVDPVFYNKLYSKYYTQIKKLS
ncbi:retron St85 family RNA-directed DNA polymerase [Kushneria phosphatilytica]|uniref:RNA-directed DNA polymerase n=1 Tax=Kushneria phosphatilytica TaxID=657387 RepID=A0A1S1NT53_9GAMM|nr:retron St85 family RNA-directed DNA polymerase [Kushneria phosphatilytica]OHV08472.1 hypothetical protein BH688_14365 [Kushneria phosphatilytica]QEL09908.1 RNA-directed DNA polymerase [Kushneria phosphatilytica]